MAYIPGLPASGKMILREFCVTQLCVVVHCRAKEATGAPTALLL